MQIGYSRAVPELQASTQTSAALAWEAVDGGGHVAAISIASPDATGLRAGVRIYSLPAQARIRVFRAGDAVDLELSGQDILDIVARNVAGGDIGESAHTWWSPLVDGEELVIEIELPAGVATNDVQLGIPTVSHLYRSVRTTTDIGTSLSCNLDARCYASSWDSQSQATAHMLFTEYGSSYVCTGTLLSDRDTTTSIPYFLSANHCISTQTAASTLQTYWFFYATSCGSRTANPDYKVLRGGATLLYQSSTTDTSFMRLKDTPPTGAVYSGWLSTLVGTNVLVAGIHHPQGDLQKISFGRISNYESCVTSWGSEVFYCNTASAQTANYLSVSWYQGLIEGGSSGSGLFLSDGKYLVGTLYGSAASTCSRAADTTYGRFDVAFARALYTYLDNAPAQVYQLSVSTSGSGSGTVTASGIACGSDCTESYAGGTSVTLTAAAASGSKFAGWSGACSGTAATCTVSMNAQMAVTASFSLAEQMTLRDAIYLYNKPVYSNSLKMIAGYHCDVFQLLLDVKSGYTDITMYAGQSYDYPDRIVDTAAMFAYSLFNQAEYKVFGLQRNTEGIDEQIGTATFFGYCYSTQPDAKVLYYDEKTQVCSDSAGAPLDCSGLGVLARKPLKR